MNRGLMVHDCAGWRMKTRRGALALAVAALPFAYFNGSAVYAQSVMRSPNLNIQSRIPTINPTVTPRIDPNIAGTAVIGIGRTTPNLRISPACGYAYRGSDGECGAQPVSSANSGGARGSPATNTQNRPRPHTAQRAPPSP